MNSNNPLAVELESENDAACEISNPALCHSLRFERRLQRDSDKDFFR
jgi:hypothetical protein